MQEYLPTEYFTLLGQLMIAGKYCNNSKSGNLIIWYYFMQIEIIDIVPISLMSTGSNRFYDNIEDMIGYRPFFLIKWCWLIITPGICTVSSSSLSLSFNNYFITWLRKILIKFPSKLRKMANDQRTFINYL